MVLKKEQPQSPLWKGCVPFCDNNHGMVVEVHEPGVTPNRNRLHYKVGEIKGD